MFSNYGKGNCLRWSTQIDALFVSTDSVFQSRRGQVAALATRYRIPAWEALGLFQKSPNPSPRWSRKPALPKIVRTRGRFSESYHWWQMSEMAIPSVQARMLAKA